MDPSKCVVSFNMSSAAEALENLSASLSLLYSEADTVMRRENAQPSMMVRFFFKVLTAWRRAVLARRVRDARSRPQRSRVVGMLRERAPGFWPPFCKCHLKQAMIVRFFFKVFTAWRRTVLACRLRDARSPPPRSRKVGLLRERARGYWPPLSAI